MTRKQIVAWLRMPSTINGIGIAGGIVSGLVAHLLSHDMTASVAVGGAICSLVHLVMPDNSAAQSSIEKLGQDVITAIVQKRIAAALPAILSDAASVAVAVASPQVVTRREPVAPVTNVVVQTNPVTGAE